jgi:phenylacetate-coenzyme A ligase PaaK-like adenylate-forming protein
LAGVHNLMMNLKHGHPPARWFSHLDPASSQISLMHRLALTGVRWGSRAPRPEFADLSQPDNVLNWMQANRNCVVRTFASSAVRLVQHAQRNGVDITGATFFTGGEPLTDARRRFIESAGVNVFPRYVASEAGLIAASCRHRTGSDDMHVYTDRVAVIPGLMFTTLSLHTGKVLLNTELGDTGELSTRKCDCVFGQLGFDLHLTNVRSQQRLTIEGMTVAAWELDAILSQLIEQAGGSPDSYQYRQAQNEHGITRLVIAISPDIGTPPSVDAIYDRMRQRSPGLAVAAEVWRQAAAIQIVREQPALSRGHKLATLVGN